MTQAEFQERVKMNVSVDEFWAINEVYNNSDLDKNEFCKMWVKMNKSRVEKAYKESIEQAKREKFRAKLFDIYTKTSYLNANAYCKKLVDFFKLTEVRFLTNECGFEDCISVSTVRYIIGKRLGIL